MTQSPGLTVDETLCIPASEFDFSFSRSSGPGGQNVNKVNSKVTLRWNVMTSDTIPEAIRQRFLKKFQSKIKEDGELVLSSDRFRDQPRNIDDCLEKLKKMLAQVLRPEKKRIKTKPSKAKVQQRLETKKRHSDKKNTRRRIDY